MREHGIPQFTVDAHRPVSAFDLLGVSFSTELGYTNMLEALDLAGIPLLARRPHRRRTRSSSPAGTRRSTPSRSPTSSTRRSSATASRPCSRSPRSCARSSATGRPAAAPSCCCGWPSVAGVYVPRFYDVELPRPTAASSASSRPTPACPYRVQKRTVMDLDEWPYPKQPLVPLAETVHERMSVEIFRGCTRGCRFCQAGMITRPVRERSITGIGEMVERGPRRDRLRGGRAALALAAPTTPRSATSPRASPTATTAPRPRCRCRAPGSTRSTSRSRRSCRATAAAPGSPSRRRAAASGCARSSTRWSARTT